MSCSLAEPWRTADVARRRCSFNRGIHKPKADDNTPKYGAEKPKADETKDHPPDNDRQLTKALEVIRAKLGAPAEAAAK